MNKERAWTFCLFRENIKVFILNVLRNREITFLLINLDWRIRLNLFRWKFLVRLCGRVEDLSCRRFVISKIEGNFIESLNLKSLTNYQLLNELGNFAI